MKSKRRLSDHRIPRRHNDWINWWHPEQNPRKKKTLWKNCRNSNVLYLTYKYCTSINFLFLKNLPWLYNIRKIKWRVYGNPLYFLCMFSANLNFFQNKFIHKLWSCIYIMIYLKFTLFYFNVRQMHDFFLNG